MLKKINLAPQIICFLPIVAIIPIGKDIFLDFHSGGINTLYKFFSSALFPSFDYLVIENSINGIKVTLSIAFIGWIISIINGLFLGLICSDIFYKTFNTPKIIHKIIKCLLAIPRGIHELIWGLLLLQVFGLTTWVAILAISIPYSALMARVFADQIDALGTRKIYALKSSGAGSLEALITALMPKLFPIIISHSAYRLECAIRGATLLGVFGLGGIGTELQLSIQSLQFKEVWTSLWILGIVVFTLEEIIKLAQNSFQSSINIRSTSIILCSTLFFLLCFSFTYLKSIDIGLAFNFIPVTLSHKSHFIAALKDLEIIRLSLESINMMLLASGLAIGAPPLICLLLPGEFSRKVISIIWLVLRLVPIPLLAILFLLFINPSISVAALALGIHNMGIMGKILLDTVNNTDDRISLAIKASGGNERVAWLYGKLSPKSIAYLSYSLYRADIILRETAVVGVVGGVGLGWQLQESLTSFAWAEVIIVVSTFVLLTMIGELISEKLKSNLKNDSLSLKAV